ncbi:Do family serine endopeptidase [Sphingosinicella xenopeptidilytica]|uniref:Do family serine endopeptidase n=1 Tax=Sphingosinicella xenopeptidilytica TaxID=364098 RepID=A0ABW3C4E2_SPHXN
MKANRSLWLLAAGAIAGTSFAMAVDQIEPQASAQQVAQLAAAAAPPETPRRVPTSNTELMLSYAPLVKASVPAVVNVYTARVNRTRRDPFWDLFFGGGRMTPQPRVEQSLGSGVIVDGTGLIVTNNHVVEGADEIKVALADRREFSAKLMFTDKQLDLALLKVETGGTALPVVPLGDSDRAEVGDVVIAIGNPFGVGQTVTHGIVSALARTGVGISDYQFFVQTDAAINPGNSGGALIGMDGRLVGINTAIYSRSGGSNGIGFAIPANMVRQFIAGAKTGKISRPWLGMAGQPVTSEIARASGLDRPMGVVINEVTKGSPAERAGVRVGDIIYAVDGKDASDPDTLRYLVASKPVGETVKLTLLRGGKAENVALKLVSPPEVPARDTTLLAGRSILAGITVANLSPALSAELGGGLPDAGVVVIGADPRAPALRSGLVQPGDILEAVNGRAVASAKGLQAQANDAAAEMTLRMSRGGSTRECYFRAPSSLQCRG